MRRDEADGGGGGTWGIRSRERSRALAVWKAEEELGHSSLTGMEWIFTPSRDV